MNLIDMRTMFFIILITAFMSTTFLIILWKQNHRRYKGINYWVGDFTLQMIGQLLVSLRGFIPDLFSIVISNTLIIYASILGYIGLEHYVDKKSENKFNIFMIMCFIFLITYFTFIKPNLAVRSFLVGGFWFINNLRSLYLLIHKAEKPTLNFTKPMIYSYSLFAFMSGSRVLNFLLNRNTSTEYFNSGSFEKFVLFFVIIVSLSVTYSLILSINKRLVIEVRKQEQKYSKIFNSSSNATFLISFEESRLLEVNEGFKNMLGYSDEEIIGNRLEDLKIWSNEIETTKVISNMDKFSKIKNLEIEFLKKSGDLITGIISSEIIHIDEEKVVLSIINDISQRKEMEKALKKNEERYKLLFENATESIVVIQDGKVVLSNQMATVLTGYSLEELSSLHFANFIYADDAELVVNNHIKRLKGEEVDRIYSFRILKKDGHVRWVEMNSLKINWEGRPATFNLLSDITERKRTLDALRVSEEKYRILFENAVEGILVIQDSEIKICNPMTSTLTGYSKEELNNIIFTELLYPDDKEMTIDFHNKRLAGISNGTKQEFRIIRKDKEIRWIESDGIKIDWNGEKATLQFVIDITERKSTEDKILYLSYFDQLTGLHNRRFYEEELKRIDTERNLPITLVMADVNGLKLTNDAFGHTAGDMLLRAIAEILKEQSRADDILARIGGDEFVILLPKTNIKEAQLIVTRIKEKVSKTVINQITASVSFGYDTKRKIGEDINKIFSNAEDNMYKKKLLESSSMKSEMITLITRSLYERDKNEQLHSERVGELCKKIAEAMNFESNQIGEMILLGMFHDIGKIGINQNVLNSCDILNEKEWNEIKKHPETGYHILKSVSEFSHIAEYVLCHHERVDGTGYPRRVSGNNIPIQAKILSIAEAYDSMIHNYYKKSMSVSNAVKELKANSNTQFDEEIVKIFIEKVINRV